MYHGLKGFYPLSEASVLLQVRKVSDPKTDRAARMHAHARTFQEILGRGELCVYIIHFCESVSRVMAP